jgi:hypothetical protein
MQPALPTSIFVLLQIQFVSHASHIDNLRSPCRRRRRAKLQLPVPAASSTDPGSKVCLAQVNLAVPLTLRGPNDSSSSNSSQSSVELRKSLNTYSIARISVEPAPQVWTPRSRLNNQRVSRSSVVNLVVWAGGGRRWTRFFDLVAVSHELILKSAKNATESRSGMLPTPQQPACYQRLHIRFKRRSMCLLVALLYVVGVVVTQENKCTVKSAKVSLPSCFFSA